MSDRRDYLDLVERTLDEILPTAQTRPAELSQAMRYAVGSGGKRIRPMLCLASAEAVGGHAEEAIFPAVAIELLHNYTLVHDDLPAMDNDVERRGKPTVWKQFGEATAILTGDALLALAYQTAARAPRNVAQIVEVLGEKGVGVVCGQVEDIAQTGDIDYIYEHKTADLFIAACVMGCLAGGGGKEEVDKLRLFAYNLGMAFQFRDDLLDGDSPYSIAETEERVSRCTTAAVSALDGLPGSTAFLAELSHKLTDRRI